MALRLVVACLVVGNALAGCDSHADCCPEKPFCYDHECTTCDAAHYCGDGVDGTVGCCNEDYYPSHEDAFCPGTDACPVSGSGCDDDDDESSLPDMPAPDSPFVVNECADLTDRLSAGQREVLEDLGFTKCCLGAFGVLVAGTDDYPDAYVLTAAVMVAEILDQDEDGVVDDPAVLAHLSVDETAVPPLLQGAPTEAAEKAGDDLGDHENFVYAFSLQTWKADGLEDAYGVITEEAYHMIHQIGYASAYPAAFGLDDFTSSVACVEMAAHQCVTWLHPENECPDGEGTHADSPLAGDCNEASCDCAEWFQQVAMVLSGNEPGWTSDLFPATYDALVASLSDDFLDTYDDPQFHMLNRPLTRSYMAGDAACEDSSTWFTKKPTKACGYVAKKAKKRCKVKTIGDDGTSAFTGCPASCGVCDYSCDADASTDDWHAKKRSKDCDWVAKKSKRCKKTMKNEDGVKIPGAIACPEACADANADNGLGHCPE